jgi:PII-like signaling protein
MLEDAEVLQIFVTADERYGDQPLYEALFDACRAHDLAGVTVLRNVEGFDGSPTIAHQHWFRHEEPVAVVIVDTAERIDKLLKAVTTWIGHGVMIRSNAHVQRVERKSATP